MHKGKKFDTTHVHLEKEKHQLHGHKYMCGEILSKSFKDTYTKFMRVN